MSLSSSERRAANWSTDRTSADTPTHVVGLCRKSTTALLAVRVYIVVGNEVMTQQQRPSHFSCLFESSVRFFTYFCCGKLENHSYHEFTASRTTHSSKVHVWMKRQHWKELLPSSDSAGCSEPKRTPHWCVISAGPLSLNNETSLLHFTMKQTRSQSWIQSWVLTAADLHDGSAETSGGRGRVAIQSQ